VAPVRCVILDDYQDVALALADWDPLGLDVRSVPDHVGSEDDLVRLLSGVAIVVVMRERTPLPRTLLERLPDLRLVVTTGMRNASIDLDACRELGITVCGTGSSSTPPVEHTWALIHSLTRHVPDEAVALRRGEKWQSTIGTDLAGATLGLLGLGKIGSRVAAVGRAFGMDVAAWSPHLTPERAESGGARLVDKETLFAGSDVVSVHLVLSESTRGIVGEPELAAMRGSAYLVNTSRAGLVDTAALLRALDGHRIAGAGLDVFDVEPLPADDPLRRHPRVVATPHLGYVTQGNYRTYFTEAVQDVAAWLAGEPVRRLD
jgi:phosphoglycerate dehydrogenase-like enzyme